MSQLNVLSEIYQKEGVHLRELSRLLNAGMPSIIHHVKNLEKERLIKKVREGRNVKLFLNYENKMIIPYIHMIEYTKLYLLPNKARSAIFEFLKQLSKKPALTVLFGSYAKSTFTKKSDIDLFLVFNKPDKEDIEGKAKGIRYKHSVEISPVYISMKEFNQKFFDEKDKFMRELKKSKIIVQGVEWWVLLENERQA